MSVLLLQDNKHSDPSTHPNQTFTTLTVILVLPCFSLTLTAHQMDFYVGV